MVFNNLHANCYQDCDLGRPIWGTQDNIERFEPNDLEKYVKEHYTPNRIVVVGIGAIDHDEFVRNVEAKFNHLKEDHYVGLPQVGQESSYFRGTEYTEYWNEMDQVYGALGYEICPWNHHDHYPLKVCYCYFPLEVHLFF